MGNQSLLWLCLQTLSLAYFTTGQFVYNRGRALSVVDPCTPTPCGYNTFCRVRDDHSAECRCNPGFFPDPDTIRGCKPQCTGSSDCPPGFRCTGTRCVQVCSPNPCGLNAICESRGNSAVCRCLSGHIGDATNRCYPEPKPTPAKIIVDPCSRSPCGPNAECRNRGDRPSCYCPTGYQGNAYQGCIKGECSTNDHCPHNRACQNYQCINPCASACGVNAECDVRNHVVICTCPKGYKGDPFRQCIRFDPNELCHPSPCGPNTNCRVQGERPICSCQEGYEGNPLTGCRHECEIDSECSSHLSCINFKCQNPCSNACGEYANCEVRNHRAVCTCPTDYLGNALHRCYPECTHQSDCPQNRACHGVKCVDPCVGVCGVNAECRVQNHKAICSCPKGYVGQPFEHCRIPLPQELCTPNPCGVNAKCTPGHDVTGRERPVCTCPSGYLGDALSACFPGECEKDSDCPDHRYCLNNYCRNPCDNHVCASNAICEPHNHAAICSCTKGHTGSAFNQCYPDPELEG